MVLVPTDESKSTLKKDRELWNKISNLIRSIANNSLWWDHNYGNYDNYHSANQKKQPHLFYQPLLFMRKIRNSKNSLKYIETYGRMILFCIFPWKNLFLCLFLGIRVKRHFPCVGPITNFIEIIVKLQCWIILILNNWKE